MGLIAKTLLVTTIVLLSTGVIAGGSVLSGEFEKETGNIEAVDHIGADRLFFIRIFDGLMPIPSRFIINHVTPDGVVEFNSGPPGTEPSIIGFIRVGPYAEYVSQYSDQYTNRKHTDSIRSGLSVSVYDAPKGSPLLADIKTILIHDDKQFILITDQNSTLWSAMMSAHERFGKQ